MALNSSKQEIIDDRRRQVARLRLRGLTQREIVTGLQRAGIVNPDTSEPWGLGTINRDLAYLKDEWKQDAASAIDEHIAAMLAEIREVRRRAWAKQDLDTVLKALKQERDLLGLDAPKRVDLRMEIIDKARQFARDWGLDEAEVIAEAESILKRSQVK